MENLNSMVKSLKLAVKYLKKARELNDKDKIEYYELEIKFLIKAINIKIFELVGLEIQEDFKEFNEKKEEQSSLFFSLLIKMMDQSNEEIEKKEKLTTTKKPKF